jgi:hypothetical protein
LMKGWRASIGQDPMCGSTSICIVPASWACIAWSQHVWSYEDTREQKGQQIIEYHSLLPCYCLQPTLDQDLLGRGTVKYLSHKILAFWYWLHTSNKLK